MARGKKESRVRIFHTSLDRRPTIPAEPAPKRACDLSLREAVPLEFRARLLKPRAARLELHNTFFEWSDEWIVAILLSGGPEHLDRTARLRASAHDAPGFARFHDDGTA